MKEGIMRDIVPSHPETKCLFRINDCSLHRELLPVPGLLREPIIIQLTFQDFAHWTAFGS